MKQSTKFDIFISHSSIDKEDFVKPLVKELVKLGLNVWYDELNLTWGSSVRESIDNGIKNSSLAIIVISETFLERIWTIKELNALIATNKFILPVLHKITHQDLLKYSPLLADTKHINSEMPLKKIAKQAHLLVRGYDYSNVKINQNNFENLIKRFFTTNKYELQSLLSEVIYRFD